MKIIIKHYGRKATIVIPEDAHIQEVRAAIEGGLLAVGWSIEVINQILKEREL